MQLQRHHKKTAVLAALGLAVALAAPAALAADTTPNETPLELANSTLSYEAATEGIVLFDNAGAALPLTAGGNIALFGVGSYKTVKGGTGSGDVNQRAVINVRKGFEDAGYTVTTSSAYWDAMVAKADTPSGGGGFMGGGVDYAGAEEPLDATTVQPTSPTDVAVYTLARNSGEGSDRSSGAGDYLLNATELANITLIGQTYKQVVVALNVGGVVDTSFYAEVNANNTDPDGGPALDSLVLASQLGQNTGKALVAVLKGDVTPSGKTVDTWAANYADYPAAPTFANADSNTLNEEYLEGIYVGYRYFDSFYGALGGANPEKVVNYPFGYGGSYTTFSLTAGTVTADTDNITVPVTVENTGTTYSGKEVVEVYYSAPQTGLDKPYQELAGYAKTDTLAPGGKQTLTVSFPTTSLASYDETSQAYTLEGGDYVIRVGNSSRNTHVAGLVNVPSTITTEQLRNEFDDPNLSGPELTSDPANFYTYNGEAAEIAAANTVTLDFSAWVTPNNASTVTQSVDVTSSDPLYALDRDKISAVTVLRPTGETDWEGTGAPYAAKTGETVVPNQAADLQNTTLFDIAKITDA
ncbi:MAG: glycoside hydrolase family 3 C-terminal domain-containing protein, partial [Bifidobacteriaceae bacterium]|nr:glycoside hydrolase family 3 C-terminal domain-containing protein [Bifidobacteriaceae bacterium]